MVVRVPVIVANIIPISSDIRRSHSGGFQVVGSIKSLPCPTDGTVYRRMVSDSGNDNANTIANIRTVSHCQSAHVCLKHNCHPFNSHVRYVYIILLLPFSNGTRCPLRLALPFPHFASSFWNQKQKNANRMSMQHENKYMCERVLCVCACVYMFVMYMLEPRYWMGPRSKLGNDNIVGRILCHRVICQLHYGFITSIIKIIWFAMWLWYTGEPDEGE